MALIEVVRRGGLAGIALRGTADTSSLGRHARAAEAALADLPFGRAPEVPHPDGFTYELRVQDDAGARSVIVGESEMPSALKRVVTAALADGELG